MTRTSVAVLGMLLAARPALALNPALDVSQYAHTSWKIRDGFTNGSIYAIAQTPDGYLWLGTDHGLFRFDGVKSVPWESPRNQRLPGNYIQSLFVSRDGTLWIGTDNGLASWRSHTLTNYAQLDGSRVGKMAEDSEGALWFVRANRANPGWTLATLRHGGFEFYGADGGPGADAIVPYEDSHGTLWVRTLAGLWRWQPGARRFYPLPGPYANNQGLSEEGAGAPLVSVPGGIARLVDDRVELAYTFPRPKETAAARLLRDRDGGLWIGTARSGLLHFHNGIVDTFAQADGLAGDDVQAAFEDREGNVWIATSNGLDRFRDTAGASMSVGQGMPATGAFSLLSSRDGSLWIAASTSLRRLFNNEVTVYRADAAQIASAATGTSRKVREIAGASWAHLLTSIHQDHLGRIWLGTVDGVGRLEGGRFVQVEGVPGGITRAIVDDRSSVWIVKDRLGLFRVRADRPGVEHIPWSALKRRDGDGAIAAVADPVRDGLWVSFIHGDVVFFANGRIQTSYTAAGGLGRGRVNQLWLDSGSTLWVATEGGLSRVKEGRIATLSSTNGLPCDSVQWFVQDDNAAMWMALSCGVVVHVSREEMAGWLAAVDGHPAAQRTVRATQFDAADGVRTIVDAAYYNAPVTKTPDGRLWFVSPDGVGVIDPRRVPINVLPPPVHIEHITANRKTYDARSERTISLPPLVRDLEVDYAALSLVAPEKNQFRYKLEGFDRDWQEAGTRRQAFYTNLQPRTYKFRVIASNNSGMWNETGAALDVSIAPAYYQTAWFQTLMVATVLTLLWMAYRLRLRFVETHQREISALNERLMKAQEQERIRIAGELHDGVMQEMLAATMMLGTAKRRIPDESEAKAKIDQVQEKLVRVGTEIRRLSHDLHPPMLQEAGLPNAVRVYCEQFSTASGIPIACDCDERARDLSRGAALALFRVLQEALGNAAKYASARHITVHLARTNGSVSIVVTDDGVGFDPGRLRSGGLGLIMMRERASQLDGMFEFASAPGHGTTIKVEIPFR